MSMVSVTDKQQQICPHKPKEGSGVKDTGNNGEHGHKNRWSD